MLRTAGHPAVAASARASHAEQPRRTPRQPRQVRRRNEQAQRFDAPDAELAVEMAGELARRVVAGPDRPAGHPDRDLAALQPDERPPESTLADVVRDLPGAHAPDHREQAAAARRHHGRQLGRGDGEVVDAVECPEVRVRAVEPLAARHQRRQIVGAGAFGGERADRHLRGAGRGALDHRRRPVGRMHAIAPLSEMHRVDTGAAAEVDEARAPGKISLIRTHVMSRMRWMRSLLPCGPSYVAATPSNAWAVTSARTADSLTRAAPTRLRGTRAGVGCAAGGGASRGSSPRSGGCARG